MTPSKTHSSGWAGLLPGDPRFRSITHVPERPLKSSASHSDRSMRSSPSTREHCRLICSARTIAARERGLGDAMEASASYRGDTWKLGPSCGVYALAGMRTRDWPIATSVTWQSRFRSLKGVVQDLLTQGVDSGADVGEDMKRRHFTGCWGQAGVAC